MLTDYSTAIERPHRLLKHTLLLGAMGCALVFALPANSARAQPEGYSLRHVHRSSKLPTRTKEKPRVSVVINGGRIQALNVQRKNVSVLLTGNDTPGRNQSFSYRDRSVLAGSVRQRDDLLYFYTRDTYGRPAAVTMVPIPVNIVTGQYITREMIQEGWRSSLDAYLNDDWEY